MQNATSTNEGVANVSAYSRFTRWRARGRDARFVCAFILTLFLLITSMMLFGWWKYATTHHYLNDFYAFRSFSGFIHTHRPYLIYNQHLLRIFEGNHHGPFFPYLYPPGTLLLVWPLVLMPYALAYAVWIGAGLLVYILAIGLPERNYAAIIACIVAPATLVTAFCGQSSLLAAGLLFGGFRLLPRRPLLAGILFGLLTYKPQLGLLVPVALIASGQWKTIGAACATAVSIAVLATLAFGWAIWPAWVMGFPAILHVTSQNRHLWMGIQQTISANLLLWGVSPRDAGIVQAVASIAMVVVIWRSFRQGSDMVRAAALAAATFLATPYGFTYDLPVMMGAVIIIAGERWRANASFALPEILVLVAAALLPYDFIAKFYHGFGSLIILTLVWVAVRRAGGIGKAMEDHGSGQAIGAATA